MDPEKEKTLRKRLDAARASMLKARIPAILVTKEENKNYLSMFYSTSFELVITLNKNYLLTDFRYIEAARELEPLFNVVETRPGYNTIAFLNEIGVKTLGLEFKNVTMDYYSRLEEGLPDDASFPSFDGMIEGVRAIKDQSEIECITMAEHIGDQAFTYILGEIRPGVTEKEIALKLELKMRELGAEKLSFDTIVASGERSSLPHGHPTDKRIEKGDFVTMDYGCVYKGYCSDMTRTVAVGSADEEMRRIYGIVLRAQTETCAAIKAGMPARDVDAVARNIIRAEGFGDCFGHGLGHGVGLEIHEAPTANPGSREILKKNMTVTIEPGIYLPKKFGVRIEDLSVVGESDIINLTGSSKDLIIL